MPLEPRRRQRLLHDPQRDFSSNRRCVRCGRFDARIHPRTSRCLFAIKRSGQGSDDQRCRRFGLARCAQRRRGWGRELTLNARCCPWTEPPLSVRLWTTKRCSLQGLACCTRSLWTLRTALTSRWPGRTRRAAWPLRPGLAWSTTSIFVLVGPDGTEWLGNDFSNGFTTTGGTADDLNNVEQLRVAPGVLPAGTANYVLKVLHRGREPSRILPVMSAVASPTPKPIWRCLAAAFCLPLRTLSKTI